MIAWIGETLLASSLLMVAVLLLRRPVAAWFGARAAFTLWLAPGLRMIMPPLPSSAAVVPPAMPAGAADYLLVTGGAGAPSLPLGTLLGICWIAGALLYLAVQLHRHRLFLADALAVARPLRTADDIPYDVVASPYVEGPVATGLVHPLILVPEDFERSFTPEQQRFALLHEQLHHRRGDIWASAAATLVAAAHWFNPLAHMCLRAFRRDMEAACDARLLAEVGRSAAAAYAETILRCATRPMPRSLCALTSVDELKGRLMMLKLNHGPARRAIGLVAAVLVATGGAVAAGAAQEEAKEETREFVRKIEIRHEGDKDVVRRGNPDEMRELAKSCPGEKFEVASTGGSDDAKEKVMLVLCAKQGESLIPALERAAADLEKRGEVPAERKAEILAKIRARIAELRANG